MRRGTVIVTEGCTGCRVDADDKIVLMCDPCQAQWEIYHTAAKRGKDLDSAVVPSDYDPTPWCSGCGAMRKVDCHCGPIAENE